MTGEATRRYSPLDDYGHPRTCLGTTGPCAAIWLAATRQFPAQAPARTIGLVLVGTVMSSAVAQNWTSTSTRRLEFSPLAGRASRLSSAWRASRFVLRRRVEPNH